MPHADAALFSPDLSKEDAYEQFELQLKGLFEDQRNWISNLANASSLLWAFFHSRPEPLLSVNWAGFYVRSDVFPSKPLSQPTTSRDNPVDLLLGPFAGLPACQTIPLPAAGSSRAPGVCAAAFIAKETQVVPDVEKRPGHIACDAKTRSEIVVPLVKNGEAVGVLDIDCEREEGFDEVDRRALERIAGLVADSCDW